MQRHGNIIHHETIYVTDSFNDNFSTFLTEELDYQSRGDGYTRACKKSGNVSKRWTPYEDKKRVSGEYNTWILIKHVDSTHDSDLLILHSEVTGNYSKPMTTLGESFERPTIYMKEFKCFVRSIMRIVNFSFVKQFSYENFLLSLTIFIKQDILFSKGIYFI